MIMEDKLIVNSTPFRDAALNRTYTVVVVSKDLNMSVLEYSGLSFFDVQEFLIFVDFSCFIRITCDSV